MNYRHIYHAGNICDVVKHAVLTLVIDRLCLKDKPFCMLDTHAGVGVYDLNDPRAVKTAEAQSGILKLLAAAPIPMLARYDATIRAMQPHYPGSPLLACHLMRPQDRVIACELHPDDAQDLRRNLRAYPNAQTHHRDGYESLRAFLPPAEKRGLVLIDPPYEDPQEFDRLAAAVIAAYQRWPQGVYMLWYPVKDRPAIWRFQDNLVAAGIKDILCAEFIYTEETRNDRLNGSGLILINPPWQMDDTLRELFPALHDALQTPAQTSVVRIL